MRRITILIGAMAALMLVPAASAFAESPHLKLNIVGTGSGEVESVEIEEAELGKGTPPIECSYNGSSQSGECENVPSTVYGEESFFGAELRAEAAPGSEIAGWTVESGAPTECPIFETGNELCLLYAEDGEGIEWEVTVEFAYTGTEYPLAIEKAGTGTGTVTSEPAGIDCGATCTHEFLVHTEVTLTAEAAPGSEFVGWSHLSSAGCGGTNVVCHVTMGEAINSKAEFVSTGPAGPPLTTVIEEGSGTVVSNPAGINCTGAAPHECTTEEIEAGTVTLTASPASGYAFKSWKGCDKKSGEFGVNGRQCTLNLTEARTVSAKFVKVWNLTLENSGGGKVSSKPGGALCLPNCSETTASFAEGKTVEVLTKPNKHFHLVEFGGDCSGTSCTLPSISADHTVSASFAEDTKYALSLAKGGGGQALIKTKGPGSVCSYTCAQSTASFYEGETVLVSWKLGKGTSSLTWSTGAGTCTGSHEGAEGSCEVTMSSAKSLVAELE